jgi:hypothetical protein
MTLLKGGAVLVTEPYLGIGALLGYRSRDSHGAVRWVLANSLRQATRDYVLAESRALVQHRLGLSAVRTVEQGFEYRF